MRNNLHLPPSCAKTTLQVNLTRLPPLRSYLYPPSVNQRVENNKIVTILSVRALRNAPLSANPSLTCNKKLYYLRNNRMDQFYIYNIYIYIRIDFLFIEDKIYLCV